MNRKTIFYTQLKFINETFLSKEQMLYWKNSVKFFFNVKRKLLPKSFLQVFLCHCCGQNNFLELKKNFVISVWASVYIVCLNDEKMWFTWLNDGKQWNEALIESDFAIFQVIKSFGRIYWWYLVFFKLIMYKQSIWIIQCSIYPVLGIFSMPKYVKLDLLMSSIFPSIS